MSVIKNINNYWIALIVSLIFLTCLLDNSHFENSTVTYRTTFFAISITFLVLLGCLLSFRKKNCSISLTTIDYVLAMLVIYILMRSAFTGTVTNSPRFIDLLSLSSFYVVLRFTSQKIYVALFYTVAFCGIIQAMYGLLQLYDLLPARGKFKLTGNFFNLGAYTSFLALSACISFGLIIFSTNLLKGWSRSEHPFNKKWIIAVLSFVPRINIILCFIVLPVSFNRTGWVACILGVAVLYTFKRKDWLSRYSKKVPVIISILLILLILFAGAIMIKKDSAAGRVLVWKVTTNIIKDNPIFGVGFDRFQAVYMNYQGSYFAEKGSDNEKQLADNVYYAFNDILQTTAELGTSGFMIIVSLVIICYRIKDRGNYSGYIAKATLLAYLVIGLFYYPHQILPLKIILVFCLALLSKALYNQSAPVLTININKLKQTATMVIALPFSLFCLFYLKTLGESYKNWKRGNDAYLSENYVQSASYFYKAQSLMCNDGNFLFQFGKVYLMADSIGKAAFYLRESKYYLNNTIIETTLGDLNKKVRNYYEAEQDYQRALDMVPNRLYTEYLLLKLYVDSKERTKACLKAEEILNKRVKVFSTAIQQISDTAKLIYDKNNCN